MTWSLVGSSVVQVVSTTSATCTYPSGTQAGDIVVIMGRSAPDAVSNMAASGFTADFSTNWPILIREATSSLSGNFSVTWTGPADLQIAVVALRCSAGAAFNPHVNGWTNNANPCVVTPPAYSAANECTFILFANYGSRTWITPPAGFTATGSGTTGPAIWTGFKQNNGSATITMDADGLTMAMCIRLDAYSANNNLFFGSNF